MNVQETQTHVMQTLHALTQRDLIHVPVTPVTRVMATVLALISMSVTMLAYAILRLPVITHKVPTFAHVMMDMLEMERHVMVSQSEFR